MSSGVQHCPFCGGRLRLVKVINVDTSRRADFLASNNAGTQELMCASCGSRVAVDHKQPTSNTVAKTETASAPAAASNQAQKQAKIGGDIAVTAMVLIGLAALAVLAYFTYRNSEMLLGYWNRFSAIVEDGFASIAKMFKK